MSKIDINISASAPTSRQLASNFGSLVGHAYLKVNNRNCWAGGDKGWEEAEAAAKSGKSVALITNRAPKRYRVTTHDILGAQYYQNPVTKELGIAINLDDDGHYDMFFPLSESSLKIGKGTAEAIASALRGEGENFFLNADAVVTVVNDANRSELNSVRVLKDILNKIEQQILGAINDNENLAKKNANELSSGKIDPVDFHDILNNGSAKMVVEVDED